jgi:hypothetical protein
MAKEQEIVPQEQNVRNVLIRNMVLRFNCICVGGYLAME